MAVMVMRPLSRTFYVMTPNMNSKDERENSGIYYLALFSQTNSVLFSVPSELSSSRKGSVQRHTQETIQARRAANQFLASKHKDGGSH